MSQKDLVEINSVFIKKVSGEKQLFSIDKLRSSLKKASAKPETIELIIEDIRKWIKTDFSTKMIYDRAFLLLKKERSGSCIKYRLKQAMLEMGPSGFPFENLIGQLFSEEGFKTEIGVVLQGKCITHEMDVIATKDKSQYLVECKYHKDQDKRVSIQVPLYVHSRVNDIVDFRKTKRNFKNYKFTPWVVTNTRFSEDSINYSRCNGLRLLAWDFPVNEGLEEMLELFKLYPLTILKTLSKDDKQVLMEKGWVTVKQLISNDKWQIDLNLTKNKLERINREIQRLFKL